MYLGANGERIYRTGNIRKISNIKLYEYKGDYIYLTNYKQWFYVGEDNELHRFYQPVTVTANKSRKLILIAGILLLFSIKK